MRSSTRSGAVGKAERNCAVTQVRNAVSASFTSSLLSSAGRTRLDRRAAFALLSASELLLRGDEDDRFDALADSPAGRGVEGVPPILVDDVAVSARRISQCRTRFSPARITTQLRSFEPKRSLGNRARSYCRDRIQCSEFKRSRNSRMKIHVKDALPPDYEETQPMTYWPRPLARPAQPIHFSDSKEGSRPLQPTEALHPARTNYQSASNTTAAYFKHCNNSRAYRLFWRPPDHPQRQISRMITLEPKPPLKLEQSTGERWARSARL